MNEVLFICMVILFYFDKLLLYIFVMWWEILIGLVEINEV